MLVRLIKRFPFFDNPEIYNKRIEGHKPVRVSAEVGEKLLKVGFIEVPEKARSGRPKKKKKPEIKAKESAEAAKEKKDE